MLTPRPSGLPESHGGELAQTDGWCESLRSFMGHFREMPLGAVCEMDTQGLRRHVGMPGAALTLSLSLLTVMVTNAVSVSGAATRGFSSGGTVSLRGGRSLRGPDVASGSASRAVGSAGDSGSSRRSRPQVGNSGDTGSCVGNEESSTTRNQGSISGHRNL